MTTAETANNRYPRNVECEDGPASLRLMTPNDEDAMLDFARSLPPHDLLFLRRKITEPKVMAAWVAQLESGEITSLVAERDGQILGCTAVVCDPLSWSPHVGELRVLVSPEMRQMGLGRALLQESFVVALQLGLEKLTAQMTVDQTGAISVFEGMGFRAEALLRDHVIDHNGKKHDIAIFGHDVEKFQAQMEAYGLTEAF